MSDLHLYNSLIRQKEKFEPINAPFVGMYVCGPTVSGESHLGHARPYVTFDVVFRYLQFLGYKVRYVRNITDVGHFEEEGRAAVDKVGVKAKLEQLEPMEMVQRYTNLYHDAMKQLGNLSPSIEPTAAGHIPEQIAMIEGILAKGLAYVSQGSVYFDVLKYASSNDYGKLSGRILEDMIAGSRELDGQDEKRNPADFALWKKAPDDHIMRWNSPWGEGFPGWHIECSAMATKYLGKYFDIHGGGMDLQFPHHESEIAQSHTCNECAPVKYWVHNNMITVNGKKMGKSYNNTITLREMFDGTNPLLDKAYSPMTVRFLILQTHYRSTLDFSNTALQAAEKGLAGLMTTYRNLQKFVPGNFNGSNTALDKEIAQKVNECYEYINDDLNTARVVASLFELSTTINSLKDGHIAITEVSPDSIDLLQKTFSIFVETVLGFQAETSQANGGITEGLMNLIIDLRLQSRTNKDWATSDKIRDTLNAIGVKINDGKEGTTWEVG